ncbi:MAG TPA: hypothetical protein VE781_15505 [Kineosporiaceae bacterium]|nr:hypothetical protein [Kineosporiaceae bacterium]
MPFVVGCGVLALAACSSPAPSTVAPSPTVPAAVTAVMSAQQKAVLADGKVTLVEYQQSFDAFSRCVTAKNGRVRVTERDPASGAVRYETGADIGSPDQPHLDTIEGRCYAQEFARAEAVFVSTDPAYRASMRQRQVQDYLQKVRPCLVANNVAAPDTIEPASERAAALFDQWNKLVAQGKCKV